MKKYCLLLVLLGTLCAGWRYKSVHKNCTPSTQASNSISCLGDTEQPSQYKLTATDRKNYIVRIDQKWIKKNYKPDFVNPGECCAVNVPLRLSNNSNTVLKYVNMSCSRDAIFVIQSKNSLNLVEVACDQNFPKVFTVAAHHSKIFWLPVSRSRNRFSKSNKFKIGINLLKYDDDRLPLDFNIFDNKTVNIIWSNEVEMPVANK